MKARETFTVAEQVGAWRDSTHLDHPSGWAGSISADVLGRRDEPSVESAVVIFLRAVGILRQISSLADVCVDPAAHSTVTGRCLSGRRCKITMENIGEEG